MRQCVLCWRIKWGVVKDRESSIFFCFKRECVVFGGLWVGSLGVRGVFTISPLCLRKNEGENFSEVGASRTGGCRADGTREANRRFDL
mgnify:FL=1